MSTCTQNIDFEAKNKCIFDYFPKFTKADFGGYALECSNSE